MSKLVSTNLTACSIFCAEDSVAMCHETYLVLIAIYTTLAEVQMGNNVDARIMNTVMNIQASSSAAHGGGACNCILHPPSRPCGPVFFRGNGGKMLCSRNLSHLFEELGAGSLPGLGINSFWAPECKCCPYRLSQRHYS